MLNELFHIVSPILLWAVAAVPRALRPLQLLVIPSSVLLGSKDASVEADQVLVQKRTRMVCHHIFNMVGVLGNRTNLPPYNSSLASSDCGSLSALIATHRRYCKYRESTGLSQKQECKLLDLAAASLVSLWNRVGCLFSALEGRAHLRVTSLTQWLDRLLA